MILNYDRSPRETSLEKKLKKEIEEEEKLDEQEKKLTPFKTLSNPMLSNPIFFSNLKLKNFNK